MQETVDGIDRAARARACRSAAVVVNLARRRRARRPRARPGAVRRARRATPIAADLDRASGSRSTDDAGRRAARRGPRARRAARARGRAAQAARRARRPDLRAAPAARRHRPRRALRAGRRPAAGRAWHEPHRRPRTDRSSPPATAAPALDVDALLDDPAHPDRRVLRLRRRRQDHHVGGARAARRRAGPQGRRAHHRPGPPAGPVDGPRELDNVPRPVPGVDARPAAARSTR